MIDDKVEMAWLAIKYALQHICQNLKSRIYDAKAPAPTLNMGEVASLKEKK